ncbi:hypothetical protein VUR80DRAFT_8785 [Thermomyces stellatus]
MAPETRPLLPRANPRPDRRLALRKGAWAEDGVAKTPQCIAHRGYKAKLPENTMAAFRAAAAAGAHAIETDLHLSRDGVVVLSHDGDLKRCFGVDKRVNECDWSYLRTLRTIKAPHEPMPSLEELLAFLAECEQEDMWLILDIKMHDDAEDLVSKTAETIALAPKPTRPWHERVVLGCWNKSYLSLAIAHLPTHPRCLINVSTLYAASLLGPRNSDLSFSLGYFVLAGPLGALFRAAAASAGHPVFAWTVNSRAWMEWAIHAGLEGVVTDEVEAYLEVATGPERAGQKGGRVVRGIVGVWTAAWLSAVHLIVVLVVAVYLLLGGGGVTRRNRRPLPAKL